MKDAVSFPRASELRDHETGLWAEAIDARRNMNEMARAFFIEEGVKLTRNYNIGIEANHRSASRYFAHSKPNPYN